MNKKNTKYLYDTYPEIFAQKDLDMSKTCMCWGFCCEDGWFHIIDTLCSFITQTCKYRKVPIPEATQVKEKFGGLRFYTDGIHNDVADVIFDAIAFAEFMSERTCEICGKPGKTNTFGWNQTLCDKHMGEKGGVKLRG